MQKIEKFEKIWRLESQVRSDRAGIELQLAGVPDFRRAQMQKSLDASKARLAAAIDELPFEDLRAYRDYRREILAEIEALMNK